MSAAELPAGDRAAQRLLSPAIVRHTVADVASATTTERPTDPSVPWLLRLRWGAVLAEAAALLTGLVVLRMALPLVPLLSLVGAAALANLLLSIWVARGGVLTRPAIGGVLAFDVLMLSALLYFSGGPANPFSVLYLVHVTLAAVVLGAPSAYAIAALATLSFGLLFYDHVPVPMLVRLGEGTVSVHLLGMWVAFAIAAALVAHFVGRVSAALAQREAELAAARERVARSERLAAVATLAAGAAHELATPLATISVIAGELALDASAGTPLAADAALIRAEVERCRAILDQLSYRAGEPIGEAPSSMRAGALLDEIAARLSPAERARVTLSDATSTPVALPRVALAQAIGSLVRNALDAQSTGGGPVELSARDEPGALRFVVEDHGAGMDEATLAHAGEPFYTTKGARGLGLGLFLARSVAEQLGGRLRIESAVGRGTRAILELPRTAVEEGA